MLSFLDGNEENCRVDDERSGSIVEGRGKNGDDDENDDDEDEKASDRRRYMKDGSSSVFFLFFLYMRAKKINALIYRQSSGLPL